VRSTAFLDTKRPEPMVRPGPQPKDSTRYSPPAKKLSLGRLRKLDRINRACPELDPGIKNNEKNISLCGLHPFALRMWLELRSGFLVAVPQGKQGILCRERFASNCVCQFILSSWRRFPNNRLTLLTVSASLMSDIGLSRLSGFFRGRAIMRTDFINGLG